MQRLTTSRNTSTENDTFTTATSHPERKHNTTKRKMGGCKCRKDCINKRCGCFSLGDKCSSKCHCGDACKNGKRSADNDGKENEECGASDDNNHSASQAADRSLERTPPKENLTGSNDVSKDAESIFVKPNHAYLTPKMAR